MHKTAQKIVDYWRLYIPPIAYWLQEIPMIRDYITVPRLENLWVFIFLFFFVWNGYALSNKPTQRIDFLTYVWMLFGGRIPPVKGEDYTGRRVKLGMIHFNQSLRYQSIKQLVSPAVLVDLNLGDGENESVLDDINLDGLIVYKDATLQASPSFKEVVDEILDWAGKNSETACLVINDGQLRSRSKLDNFYSIPVTALGKINEYLLKRSNERASIWKNQARFNRAAFLSCFIILIALSIFQSIRHHNERESSRSQVVGIYNDLLAYHCIHETDQRESFVAMVKAYLQFQVDYLKNVHGLEDINLAVYVQDTSKIYAEKIVFTDKYGSPLRTAHEPTSGRRKIELSSITGCSFLKPDYFIYYREHEGIVKVNKDRKVSEMEEVSDCIFEVSHGGSNPRVILHYTKESQSSSYLVGVALHSIVDQDLARQGVFDDIKQITFDIARMKWHCDKN